jgi:hypothetical protein
MDKGKANMGGGEIAAVGAGGIIAAFISGRMLKGAAGNWLAKMAGGAAGTAAGVAEGKTLQAAAGVTPVFVTNWPSGGIGGSGSSAGVLAKVLPGIAGASFAPPVLAGLLVAGGIYGAYKLSQYNTKNRLDEMNADKRIKETGYLNDSVRDAILKAKGYAPPVTIDIQIDKDGRHIVKSSSPDTKTSVSQKNRGSFYRGMSNDGVPTFAWPSR